ncbi:cytochrome b562 [Acinetobacter sp. ME22]|uniref:cytochrome b562 n=1 Tax=Acinetobacter sp. ME22 TaxID=2904802 RepID=UPI001EDB5FBC|nr:cytochrome b562 [Acinetobacter sp. ME22]MCG2573978.1 cytochrome b562 [Acinetobacter sp. ME22]
MKKIGRLIGTVVLACIMQSSFADDLGQDMEMIAKNYDIFQNTQSPSQAVDALSAMQQAVLDAKKSIPMTLIGEPDHSPKVQQYQKGLDDLNAELTQTVAMVKAGHLQQAREQAIPVIDQMKKTNHQKFRN